MMDGKDVCKVEA